MRIIATAVLTVIVIITHAQQHTDKQRHTAQFDNLKSDYNVLYVDNINGNIRVEGYSGTEISLEANRSIKARSQQQLDEAKSRINLKSIDRGDTIIYFIDGLCAEYVNKTRFKNKDHNRWSYNWENCNRDREVNYQFDFTLKVPINTNLVLSTVNEGDIEVSSITGNLTLRNVNGAISMEEIAGDAYAHTINGDVKGDFVNQPTGYNYFYTLNGDINVNYPDKLDAEMTFKSYNGDLFTNINEIEHTPMTVQTNGKKGFKVSVVSLLKLGSGGPRLEFETFNGNVYLKENQRL